MVVYYKFSKKEKRVIIGLFIVIPILFILQIYAVMFFPILDSAYYYYSFIILWVSLSLIVFKLIFGSLLGKENRGRKHHKKLMTQDSSNFYLSDYLKHDQE